MALPFRKNNDEHSISFHLKNIRKRVIDAARKEPNAQEVIPSTSPILETERRMLEVLLSFVNEADLEKTDRQKKNILHVAAEVGPTWEGKDFTKTIIEYFNGLSKASRKEREGFSPVYKAINALDSKGNTPLHLALENGHLEIAKLLINNDAKNNIQNNNGDTPLHMAIENGQLEIAESLIQHGGKNNIQNIRGYTPLSIAKSITRGSQSPEYTEIIELLKEYDHKNNIQNNNEDTSLHKAIEKGDLKMVRSLIKNGANSSIKDRRGDNPLHVALKAGNKEIVQLLIDQPGVTCIDDPLNEANGEGYPPLHLAISYNHDDCAESLIKKRVRVTKVDLNGDTPLHIALKMGNTTIAQSLIESNIHLLDKLITKANTNGDTPMSMLNKLITKANENDDTLLHNALKDIQNLLEQSPSATQEVEERKPKEVTFKLEQSPSASREVEERIPKEVTSKRDRSYAISYPTRSDAHSGSNTPRK